MRATETANTLQEGGTGSSADGGEVLHGLVDVLAGFLLIGFWGMWFGFVFEGGSRRRCVYGETVLLVCLVFGRRAHCVDD